MTFLACWGSHPESEPPTNDIFGITTNKSNANVKRNTYRRPEVDTFCTSWGKVNSLGLRVRNLMNLIYKHNFFFFFWEKNSFFEGSWCCRMVLVREQCNLQVLRHALWEHSRLVSFSKQSHSYTLGAWWEGGMVGGILIRGLGQNSIALPSPISFSWSP